MKNRILEFVDIKGRSPFSRWFNRLDKTAAAKVAATLYRMEQGNLSNTKGLGDNLFEYRIDFGPGYRIYFGKDGENLIILVGGGTKRHQSQDIKKALGLWQEYKKQKYSKVH